MLVALGLLTATAPLSLDLYLPGLPQMAADLDSPTSAAQLTISACLIGLAVGQLVFGPISDRFGRRRPLLLALIGYLVVSTAIVGAPTMDVVIGLRFLQGFTGAGGIVIALAIVRDRLDNTELPAAVAMLMFIGGLAPILSPVLGGVLLLVTPWRGLFAVLAGFAAVMLATAVLRLPESLPAERRRKGGLTALARSTGDVVRDRVFVAGAALVGCSGAAMFVYISMSSFVLQDEYGLGPTAFSLVFAANGLAFMAGNRATVLALRRGGRPEHLLVFGTATLAGSVVAMQLSSRLDLGLPALLVALLLSIGSVGSVMPNATSVALMGQQASAGTASAIVGATQNLSGAAAGSLATLGGASSAAMADAMTVAGLAAVVALVVLVRARARQEGTV